MSRSGFVGFVAALPIVTLLLTGLIGCSSGGAVKTTSFPVPASIALVPGPNLSLEIGTNQSFTATTLSSGGTAIAQPISYQSSNTAVVTVAANGLACAGSWDSLSNPHICTPGPVGVAQVTATAQGVSSPPTTVYVHQHIDKVAVSQLLLPNQRPPTNPCLSVGQTANYQATAFSRGSDITSTVGIFNWQTQVASVATLNTSDPALLPGQVQVTAKVPGLTPIYASIGNTNSLPIYFTTCPVQSISLTVTSSSSSSETITPTVLDTLGTTITAPLTWSSSEPASVTVSSSGSATTSSSSAGGGATIIASCAPPTCNAGFDPTIPVYPKNVVTMLVPGTGNPKSASVYVSSTSCGTTDGCFSTVISIAAPGNTLGTFISLPATPNSLVFNRQGTDAYLGTNSGLLGTVGLAVLNFSSNSVSQFVSAPGKVLAVSPDGTKVVISDTADVPNQVHVFDTTSNTGPAFQISGATAADFSPDSLKAYILAGSTLYVYSKLDALRTIPLAAPAHDVTFLAEGAFAYLAGADPAGVAVRRTCDNGSADTLSIGSVPNFVKTLPGPAVLLPGDTANSFHVLALNPPDISIISANAPVGTSWAGCTPIVVDNNPPPKSFNLGQDFVPKQLIVSQDGSTAYVVPSNLGSILVFNVAGQNSTAIGLAGNATPLSASLTPDGTLLYVGASDQTIHVLDTVSGSDLQQISFPQGQSLCQNSAGQPFGITCLPDLVAVKP